MECWNNTKLWIYAIVLSITTLGLSCSSNNDVEQCSTHSITLERIHKIKFNVEENAIQIAENHIKLVKIAQDVEDTRLTLEQAKK